MVKVEVFSNFSKLVDYLYEESDNTALVIFRILFGICLFLDVPQERGLEDADLRFGDPNHCFFPLFNFIKPISVQYACILYSFMWIGSLGIITGYKLSTSCILYVIPYVYLFLLDKSRWNNHSYLFLLIVILLSSSNASREYKTSPRWNLLILKFQFFLLYFYAAIKKMEYDWLSGWSMRHLSQHKIFQPIASVFSEEFVDYYLVHLGGFAFDLSVGFLLIGNPFSRKIGFILCLGFHLLNSQVFDIGMFPYVCLASLILFCETDEFPLKYFIKPNTTKRRKLIQKQIKPNCKRITTTLLLLFYTLIQITLPFTHSITKGYNNWTNGLYGYSWDMMVYSWSTLHTKITVRNVNSGTERYLDPDIWTTNDRWSSHADMAKQYSNCIARNLEVFNLTNLEVYFDVWKSLNGRFQQRVFDPRIDILSAPWNPWDSVQWVLPIFHEFSDWREEKIQKISSDVRNWGNNTNVIFVADYPGLTLENFMPKELKNVSLILLKGEILVEQDSYPNVTLKESGDNDWKYAKGVNIVNDQIHKIHTISQVPASYMYTYYNSSAVEVDNNGEQNLDGENFAIMQVFTEFLDEKLDMFARSYYLIVNSYLNVFFDVPMVLRKNIAD